MMKLGGSVDGTVENLHFSILMYSMQCWTHILLKLRHKTVYIPLDHAYVHVEFILCRSGQLLCWYSRVCVSRTTTEQSGIQEVYMYECLYAGGGWG